MEKLMNKLNIRSKRVMVILLIAAAVVILAAVFVFVEQIRSSDGAVVFPPSGDVGASYAGVGYDSAGYAASQYGVPTSQIMPTIVIHISGEVYNPGIVTLYSGSRVWDAVQAAGGLTADADLNAINLARVLRDEDHIVVFSVEDNMPTTATIGADAVQTDGRININTATSEELQALSGVGPAIAGNIIRHREARGGFATIEEIMNVSGIGERIFENLRDSIRVY